MSALLFPSPAAADGPAGALLFPSPSGRRWPGGPDEGARPAEAFAKFAPSPAALRAATSPGGRGDSFSPTGAASASITAITLPSEPSSPTLTRTSLITPAIGDGTSNVALSDSSVIRP